MPDSADNFAARIPIDATNRRLIAGYIRKARAEELRWALVVIDRLVPVKVKPLIKMIEARIAETERDGTVPE